MNYLQKTFAPIISLALTPFALYWARRQEIRILKHGRALTQREIVWSLQLGIVQYDKVRILIVPQVPTPIPTWLQRFIQWLGFPITQTAGMCLRYGIFIDDRVTASHQVIAHELVHTQQYEELGGFANFLKQYITECIIHGYNHAPMEEDANIRSKQLIDTHFKKH